MESGWLWEWKVGKRMTPKNACIYRGMAAAIKQVIIYHLTFIWWGRHNQNVPKCDRELALSITTYYNTYAITIKQQILRRSHTFKCRLGVLSSSASAVYAAQTWKRFIMLWKTPDIQLTENWKGEVVVMHCTLHLITQKFISEFSPLQTQNHSCLKVDWFEKL